MSIREKMINKTIDIEFFDMTTTTWDIGNTVHKNTSYTGATTKWKKEEVLDKLFVKMAKKLEKNKKNT